MALRGYRSNSDLNFTNGNLDYSSDYSEVTPYFYCYN